MVAIPKYLASMFVLLAVVGLASSSAHVAGAADQAKAYLESKGWRLGLNPGQRLVVIASVAVAQPSSSAAYIAARQAAFDRAFADARKSAAEFMAAEVKTALKSKSESIEVLGDPALAKAVTGAAQNAAFRSSAEFDQVVDVASQAAVAGLYACQAFESVDDSNRSTVAIVAAVSERSSRAARGEEVRIPCEQPNASAWFDAISLKELPLTVGVYFLCDGDGILRPISVAHARISGADPGADAAADVAQQIAVGQLRSLLGEGIASQSLLKSASQAESATGLPATFKSTTNYRKVVEAAARERKMPIQTIGKRRVTDATPGVELMVVAVALDPDLRGGSAEASSASPDAGQAAGGSCPPVPDNMASSIRQVKASGSGATRAAAIEAALLEAVRRDGASVKGNSLLERRFSEAMDSVGSEVHEKVSSRTDQSSKVETFSKGFVHSYDVIRESSQEGQWDVSICANLVRFDPKNPRFGLRPTVAVLPFVCTPSDVRVAGAPSQVSEATAPCEGALDQAIQKSKLLTVLAERDMPKLREVRRDVAQRVADGRAEEIEGVKLGRELTADFVVVGKVVRAEWTGQPGQRPQNVAAADTATATVEASLINVASGETAWTKRETKTLSAREVLLVRAGRDLQDPAEQALSPLQLVVSRTSSAVAQSLAAWLPTEFGAPSTASAPPSPVRIVRVAGGQVTLDSTGSAVAVGARFVVNLLVEVPLANGRTEIDRDRVATIEVTEINSSRTLAKARVLAGDAGSIDPAKCEAVPEPK